MKRLLLLIATLMALLFFKYCATGEEFVRPDVDFKKYQRIAVFPLTDYYTSPGSGNQVADIIAFEMMKRHFNIIERNNINRIIQEQRLSLSGLVDDNSLPEAGKILGVPCILTGSINEYVTTWTYLAMAKPPTWMPVTAVGLTLKLIDTETAEIVWSATARATQIGQDQYSNCAKKAVVKVLDQMTKHL